jgi:hypothetical protein
MSKLPDITVSGGNVVSSPAVERKVLNLPKKDLRVKTEVCFSIIDVMKRTFRGSSQCFFQRIFIIDSTSIIGCY